ncbi:MAG: helix-turn-helix transcriptional regulator [Oscillospiraceae bacterium]|nr:helix-turn-helix transcriptional regulator [Oscillospiraceae bacterium]
MRMRLKDLREDNDMTQQELASLLHIRQNTWSQCETGQRQISLDCLIRLSEIFGTSVDYLLGLTDEPRPYPRNAR